MYFAIWNYCLVTEFIKRPSKILTNDLVSYMQGEKWTNSQ